MASPIRNLGYEDANGELAFDYVCWARSQMLVEC